MLAEITIIWGSLGALLFLFICFLLWSIKKQKDRNSEFSLKLQNTELENIRLQAEQHGLNIRILERDQALEQREKDLKVLTAENRIQVDRHSALQLANRESSTRLEQFQQLLAETREQLQRKEVVLEMVTAEKNLFDKQLSELKTRLKEKEINFAEQRQNFEQSRQQLTTEFQNLANEILEQKSKHFTETNKHSMDGLLQPFKTQMEQFRLKVEDIHHKDTQQQAELKTELGHLKELNQKITQEAHELANALKGQKKMQGNWGELILENVLERSGLRIDKDYRREVSVLSEEGDRQRPDVVVYLPQDKHLIIDAKVSLNAYTRYVNADSDAEQNIALKEHAEAFSARIKELSERDYARARGMNSPEMVFMFVPIESAFVDALKADESLFQHAIEQNVLVATPTTLLTSLNIVRQLWRFEDQSKHTAELASKADGVYKKLRTFLSSFQGIKKAIDKAADEYGKAENQLISGRGNLIKQAEDFKKFAPTIQGELPVDMVEKAAMEVEYRTDQTV